VTATAAALLTPYGQVTGAYLLLIGHCHTGYALMSMSLLLAGDVASLSKVNVNVVDVTSVLFF